MGFSKKKKALKLNSGKEIFRTEKITIIQFQNNLYYYSIQINQKVFSGEFRFSYKKIRMVFYVSIFLLVLYYFYPKPVDESGLGLDDSEILENDKEDKRAKKADASFLENTEKKKLSVIRSNDLEKQKEKSKKFKIITYQVKKGENLSSIATKFHVRMESIAGSSGINVDDMLIPGQILKIPNKTGLLYKIKKGDTVAKVADYYKVKLEEIQEENHLDDLDILAVGKKIFLPGAIIPEIVQAWLIPVASKIITSGFGWRSFPTWKFHEGLDLKANYENVKAVKNGLIIFSGWMGGYGNTIVIEHNEEMKSLYAHNSKLMVKRGQYVSKGQVISRSGCTGYCFGPHLHLEMIKDGKSINPVKYLTGLQYEKNKKAARKG